MGDVREKLGVSERRACRVLGQPRSTQRRRPYVPDDEPRLVVQMIELARQYGRYGYRRITALLRHDGWKVNHKRIERLWRREGLKVPKKQPKRGRLWLNDGSCIRLRPQYKDHVWAYDFVHARTHDGRPLRMLTLVDEYTRECLSIDVARRLNSEDVLERLTWLFVIRGVPKYLRSDNGSEFTCTAVRSWLTKVGVATLFIEPGSPWENGYVESFNGKLRDELLNGEVFYTLLEAKVLVERWRQHYNRVRPHSSLGYRPPAPEAIAFEALAASCATWPGDSTPPAADLVAEACWTNIRSGTMDGGRSDEVCVTVRASTISDVTAVRVAIAVAIRLALVRNAIFIAIGAIAISQVACIIDAVVIAIDEFSAFVGDSVGVAVCQVAAGDVYQIVDAVAITITNQRNFAFVRD